MSNGNLPLTTVEKIALQLEGDMRQRGLRPGDRYLTAAQASELFEVNSMTIHRAMRALAARDMLVRKRNRGTFVGPKFNDSNPSSNHSSNQSQRGIDVLHVVMAIDYHRTQNFSSDTLVDEFSRALPGVTIQVHHLIENGAAAYIDRQIERLSPSHREGFVLIRCTREVQLRISESGLPAVIFGHAYPGVRLPCISHDQEAVGRYMASYALQQGARRFALLTHARWRLGDHRMIDAATALLGGAGVQLDAVKIRSVVPEREIVHDIVREMMEGDDPPDAFLCRSDFYAHAVSEMAKGEGRAFNGQPHSKTDSVAGCSTVSGAGICIVSGSHAPPNGKAPFARVVSSHSLAQQVQLIAKLLDQQNAAHQQVAQQRVDRSTGSECDATRSANTAQSRSAVSPPPTTATASPNATASTGVRASTGDAGSSIENCSVSEDGPPSTISGPLQPFVIPVKFENSVSDP